MSAPSRTNGAMQMPSNYDHGVLARIARQYDAELSRITAYAGTVVWDPASVAVGGTASTPVVVPGVKVNVLANVRVFAPYALSGLLASGYVSADDQVTIALANNTAGAVDLGSGTWGVTVENFVRTT